MSCTRTLSAEIVREHGDKTILYLPNKENFGRRLYFRRTTVLGIPPLPKGPEELETIPKKLGFLG